MSLTFELRFYSDEAGVIVDENRYDIGPTAHSAIFDKALFLAGGFVNEDFVDFAAGRTSVRMDILIVHGLKIRKDEL